MRVSLQTTQEQARVQIDNLQARRANGTQGGGANARGVAQEELRARRERMYTLTSDLTQLEDERRVLADKLAGEVASRQTLYQVCSRARARARRVACPRGKGGRRVV